MEVIRIIEATDSGNRIDKYLSEREDLALSRSHIQKLIKDGDATVNGKSIKANYVLKAGDEILLSLQEAKPVEILPQDIQLDILYEDEDLLIVNKPKDMVVHPAPGHEDNTLVNAVLYHCGDSLSGINGEIRPGIVHRIDKDTTGSLVICKNDAAHMVLAQQLSVHSITRKYRAIVYGVLKDDTGTIHKTIGRDPKDRKKMAVGVVNGRDATTHYRVLERFDGYTYIECTLETGRTHQIRVHMASIGYPVLGDPVYAGRRKNSFETQGQVLHAYVLGFQHPKTGEYLEVTAPLPAYFEDLLETLRRRTR
ncbi:MAG: RluA family pseudouridine synthase [Lachnospiraceae bacterium]|nr:RluA family pseudouridine synthase [Lachnospiraceae bacterium]